MAIERKIYPRSKNFKAISESIPFTYLDCLLSAGFKLGKASAKDIIIFADSIAGGNTGMVSLETGITRSDCLVAGYLLRLAGFTSCLVWDSSYKRNLRVFKAPEEEDILTASSIVQAHIKDNLKSSDITFMDLNDLI